MYRQIRVHEDDWDVQRIVWRDQADDLVTDYCLTTVTYGLASAPYLAIRTLQQLAKDEGDRFPAAARVLASDVYMDDILSGVASDESASRDAEQLIELCRAGGFPLRKWASNSTEVLASLPGDVTGDFSLEWPEATGRSVLGLDWRPSEDSFSYRLLLPADSEVRTKRMVLSLIARLFDPLGWLAPLTVRAKIFMQSLWLLKIDWDDPLPSRECASGEQFKDDLSRVGDLRVPRWLGLRPDVTVQLVGFSDASERAYAAVVYLRCEHPQYGVTLRLLAAKTKVAPLKQLAIP